MGAIVINDQLSFLSGLSQADGPGAAIPGIIVSIGVFSTISRNFGKVEFIGVFIVESDSSAAAASIVITIAAIDSNSTTAFQGGSVHKDRSTGTTSAINNTTSIGINPTIQNQFPCLYIDHTTAAAAGVAAVVCTASGTGIDRRVK